MNRNKLIALARHLECSLGDLEATDDTSVEYGRHEYLVLTDAEADKACHETIADSVWAFNASFLGAYIPGSNDAISIVQEKCGEDCNELLKAAIGDRFAEFVQDAIGADGRGHFLSSYDSEETEISVPIGKGHKETFFLYRRK